MRYFWIGAAMALSFTGALPLESHAQGSAEPMPGAASSGQLVVNADGTDHLITLENNQTFPVTLTGEADQILEFTLRGAGEAFALDPYLTLLQGDLAIASDDDSGGSLNSRFMLRLPESGTYVLQVSEFFGKAGEMVLNVRVIDPPSATPQSLAIDGSVSRQVLGTASPLLMQPGNQYIQRYEIFSLPPRLSFRDMRRDKKMLRVVIQYIPPEGSEEGTVSDLNLEMGFSSPFGFAPLAQASYFGCNNTAFLDVDPAMFPAALIDGDLREATAQLRFRVTSYSNLESPFTISASRVGREELPPPDGCPVYTEEYPEYTDEGLSLEEYAPPPRTLEDIAAERASFETYYADVMRQLDEEEAALRNPGAAPASDAANAADAVAAPTSASTQQP